MTDERNTPMEDQTIATEFLPSLGDGGYWADSLDDDILELPVATVCGRAIADIITKTETLIGLLTDHVDTHDMIRDAARQQCETIFYG